MGAWSGQTTVAAAGTAVVVDATATGEAFAVKALAGNTGTIYIGNDGADDVTSANGYPLAAGDEILFEARGPNSILNLSDFYIDAGTNGDGVAWLRLR